MASSCVLLHGVQLAVRAHCSGVFGKLFVLLGVDFVPQWVHNGHMESTATQQRGHTTMARHIRTASGTVHAMSTNDPRVTLCNRMYDGAPSGADVTCGKCAKRALMLATARRIAKAQS